MIVVLNAHRMTKHKFIRFNSMCFEQLCSVFEAICSPRTVNTTQLQVQVDRGEGGGDVSNQCQFGGKTCARNSGQRWEVNRAANQTKQYTFFSDLVCANDKHPLY